MWSQNQCGLNVSGNHHHIKVNSCKIDWVVAICLFVSFILTVPNIYPVVLLRQPAGFAESGSLPLLHAGARLKIEFQNWVWGFGKHNVLYMNECFSYKSFLSLSFSHSFPVTHFFSLMIITDLFRLLETESVSELAALAVRVTFCHSILFSLFLISKD